MPIDEQLLSTLVEDPTFWRDYLSRDQGSDTIDPRLREVEEPEIVFPIGGGYQLSVYLTERVTLSELVLWQPGEVEPNTWLSTGGMIDVLRWEELELFVQAAQREAPERQPVSLPLLFLQRFTPVVGPQAERSLGILEQAWSSTGLSRGTTLELLQLVDSRRRPVRWVKDAEERWLLANGDEEEQASLRECGCSDEFPFEVFHASIEAAKRCLEEPES